MLLQIYHQLLTFVSNYLYKVLNYQMDKFFCLLYIFKSTLRTFIRFCLVILGGFKLGGTTPSFPSTQSSTAAPTTGEWSLTYSNKKYTFNEYWNWNCICLHGIQAYSMMWGRKRQDFHVTKFSQVDSVVLISVDVPPSTNCLNCSNVDIVQDKS